MTDKMTKEQVIDAISQEMRRLSYEDTIATERVEPIIREKQAPPGSLGLPELLDKRRIEYAIPDGAFKEQAVFDRVYIYQKRIEMRDTFSDESLIYTTSVGKQREHDSVPHGIIVSAGLKALDTLRSNGIDLGHIVGFIQLAPYRKEVAVVEGVSFYLMLLRVGDITGSFDLAEEFRKGRCKVHTRVITGDDGLEIKEHIYLDESGKIWDPIIPFMPADY